MKWLCVIKYVPEVDNFKYDYEKNILIRENVRLILNPDDACAVAFALKQKESDPESTVDVITMAPQSVIPYLEDLIRVGVDKGILLSDVAFAGSDTYVTGKILAKYIATDTYDCILSGTHAIDGDTSHVPAQLGEWLNINQIAGVINVLGYDHKSVTVKVDFETSVRTYEVPLPAIVSLTRDSGYKLPYVRRADLEKEVRGSIRILNCEELGLTQPEVGLKGSLTKVTATYTKQFEQRDKQLVQADDVGVDTVLNFLIDKGYV